VLKAAILWLFAHPLLWGVVLIPFTICGIAISAVIRSSRKPKDRTTAVFDEKIKKIIDEVADDAKRAGAQAAMLWIFSGWAKDLIQRLEETWDHWNYEGQHLIHPLDARLDNLDFSKDSVVKLSNERRDFMVEYAAHLRRLRVDLSGFSSSLTQTGILRTVSTGAF
jgi:hypothetical protein